MSDEVLLKVVEAADRAAIVEREMQEAVDEARAAGCTWTQIGEALSVSRQAAWRRFSHD